MPRPKITQPENSQEPQSDVKTIFIVISGSGDASPTEVNITPGITAYDVLSQLQLKGFRLKKPGGGYFALYDNLYPAVEPYQKLYATKDDVEGGAPSDGASNLSVAFDCDMAGISK